MTIDDLSLEDKTGDLCVSDWVEISSVNYNSRANNSYTIVESLGRRCGNNPGESFITGRSVLIEFRSDHSIDGRGFRLNVDSMVESCGGLVTDNGADIASPGFPIRYNPGLNCTWEIQSLNPGYFIELQFVKLQLRPSDGK